jgi:hypothetical protein
VSQYTHHDGRLTFEEATHTYRLNGDIIPSITQSLTSVGLNPGVEYISEYYRERGRKVHLLTQLYEENDLDPASVDPAFEGYLESWIACLKETGWKSCVIEGIACNEEYRYGCTVDRIGDWNEHRNCILDIKTGEPMKSVGAQLSGCEWAVAPWPHEPFVRIAVKLDKDGVFNMDKQWHLCEDPYDKHVAMMAVSLANWKISRGVKWRDK